MCLMASRKDKRTGNYYFRKWVRLPDGTKERIYGALDKFGQPFKKKGDCNQAEHDAIEELKKAHKPEAPLFSLWFWGPDESKLEPVGRFWLEWVVGGPKPNSPAERANKISIYQHHLKAFFGPLRLDQIDVERINVFRAQLRGRVSDEDGTRVVGEKRINNILAVLSKSINYAQMVGLIARAPAVGLAKLERPEIEFIEFEEVALLLRAALFDREPEYYVAILLAYEAGLRIGEIKALNWDKGHVDMRAQTISVQEQVRSVKIKDKHVETFGGPKGRRRRVIQMSPLLYAALKDRIRVGFVVPRVGGGHKRKYEVEAAMERIARRAGLGGKVGAKWHIGRHTFATHAAMLGVNPWTLQQWMGHQHMAETEGYVKLANERPRPIPAELLRAGADIADPAKRILAMLSARADLGVEMAVAASGDSAASAAQPLPKKHGKTFNE